MFQDEIFEEIEQVSAATQLINEIRALRQIADGWEMTTKLKTMADRIAKLSTSDAISVMSFAKQHLNLRADDMRALKIEVKNQSRSHIIRKHNTSLDLNQDGIVKPSDKNLISIFKSDPDIADVFAKNTFTNEIDVLRDGAWHIRSSDFPRTLKNDDLNQLKMYLINRYDVEFTIKQIDEAVKSLSIINHYDPLLDYLNPLQWDKTPRLETWLIDYCGAVDNAYTRWLSKLVLTAAVARAYVPGIKYDHVVVLASNQGSMKTTLIETLASEPFFNSLTLSDNDRDTVQKMQGTWIAELPEGMPFKRREINDLKNFVSSKKNKERFAFEHIMETYQRRIIFIMTINPTSIGYLTDETGNRRYLPVRINGKINIPAIRQHRDQLFAEAKHLFRGGFPLYIPQEDQDILNGLADEHAIAETHDEWESIIVQWLINTSLPSQIPAIMVWTDCLKGRPSDYSQQNHGARIGRILRKLGAVYTSKRDGVIIVKGFKITELVAELRCKSVENVIEQAENAEKW